MEWTLEESPRGTETPPAEPKRTPTAGQIVFDVLFGIVLPALCLLLDPGILRGSIGVGPPLLSRHAAAAYVFILPAMALLATWMAFRRGAILLAGPLLAGGAVALAIGIVLLPLSLPMCLVGIGFLGLVPFGTAVAFFRNGIRALRAASAGKSPTLAYVVASVMGVTAVLLPVAVQASVERRIGEAVEAALAGDPKREAEAVARLKPFGWVADPNAFLGAWRSTSDAVQHDRLARVWHESTGGYLEAMFID